MKAFSLVIIFIDIQLLYYKIINYFITENLSLHCSVCLNVPIIHWKNKYNIIIYFIFSKIHDSLKQLFLDFR